MSTIVAWMRHVVVVPDRWGKTITAIYKPDCTLVRTIDAHDPEMLVTPLCATVVWPDEALVIALERKRALDLAWVDLEGAPSVIPCDLRPTAGTHVKVSSTADGAVLVSSPIGDIRREPDELWTIDRSLDAMYGTVLEWPFEDREYVTACITRTGEQRWREAGRAACLADDVVVLQEPDTIVARRATDGSELWRRPARDRFVFGGVAMPAWSDDRVFVLDRHARRREAWAREADAARIHQIDLRSPFRVTASISLLADTKRAQPLTVPSVLCCLSTRTGDELWRADVDGDIVSFYAHPKWVACMIAGDHFPVRVWLPDGVSRANIPLRPDGIVDATWWPQDPTRFASIVGGDDDHVVIAENRGSNCHVVKLEIARARQTGELRIPFQCVSTPFRFRLTNRASVVLVGDAAVARLNQHLFGGVFA